MKRKSTIVYAKSRGRRRRRRFQPTDTPTELDRAQERDRLAGGTGAGIDSFAYDSRGNDTGLRESDFI